MYPIRLCFCCGFCACVAVCCSALQCAAMCCVFVEGTVPHHRVRSTGLDECVAVCCRVLQSVAVGAVWRSVFQCVAVCCSLLQCVAVCSCRGYCATSQGLLDWLEVQDGEDT